MGKSLAPRILQNLLWTERIQRRRHKKFAIKLFIRPCPPSSMLFPDNALPINIDKGVGEEFLPGLSELPTPTISFFMKV